MAYGKIFESLYSGSLVGAGLNVLALWPYCIANAKPPGTIELNPIVLAAIFGCPIEQIRLAIDVLCAADPESRSPEHDGRRLIREGNFLYSMPTWPKYQAIRNDVARRDQNRRAQRKWRDKHKAVSHG